MSDQKPDNTHRFGGISLEDTLRRDDAEPSHDNVDLLTASGEDILKALTSGTGLDKWTVAHQYPTPQPKEKIQQQPDNTHRFGGVSLEDTLRRRDYEEPSHDNVDILTASGEDILKALTSGTGLDKWTVVEQYPTPQPKEDLSQQQPDNTYRFRGVSLADVPRWRDDVELYTLSSHDDVDLLTTSSEDVPKTLTPGRGLWQHPTSQQQRDDSRRDAILRLVRKDEKLLTDYFHDPAPCCEVCKASPGPKAFLRSDGPYGTTKINHAVCNACKHKGLKEEISKEDFFRIYLGYMGDWEEDKSGDGAGAYLYSASHDWTRSWRRDGPFLKDTGPEAEEWARLLAIEVRKREREIAYEEAQIAAKAAEVELTAAEEELIAAEEERIAAEEAREIAGGEEREIAPEEERLSSAPAVQ